MTQSALALAYLDRARSPFAENWKPYGMNLTPARLRLIERLKSGPLECADHNGLAPTKSALKGLVFQLRAGGYRIETVRDYGGGTGFYRMVG